MDFTEIMANNSNEQLLKIVTELKNNYQPAAIIAAEKELEKRNLSELQIQKVKETPASLSVLFAKRIYHSKSLRLIFLNSKIK